MKFDEQKLKTIAKPYMQKARAGDWKHALRVVKWVKLVGKGRDDLYLQITAAYIHDIGWSGIAPKGKLDLDKMLKLEKNANNNSKKLVTLVLKKMDYTTREINSVNKFIAAADAHESKSEDEEIIVDADNLSKLCVAHIKEKYEPDSYPKIIFMLENNLSKGIKTDYGKRIYPDLLLKLKKSMNIR